MTATQTAQCEDCKLTFTVDRLTCAWSAVRLDECDCGERYENKAHEPYCQRCWNREDDDEPSHEEQDG